LNFHLYAAAQLSRHPLSQITLPLPKTAAHQLKHARSLSLSKNQLTLFEQTILSSETLPDLMASSGNISFYSGSSAQRKVRAHQVRFPRVRSGEFSTPQALSSGTGFGTLPPLATSTNLLNS